MAYGSRRGEIGGAGGILWTSCTFCCPPDGGPVEFEIRPSPSSKSSPTKLAEARVSREFYKVHSFAETLKSKPQSCVMKNGGVDLRREAVGSVQVLRSAVGTMEKVVWSSRSLDLFPMPIHFESKSDGEGVRYAVDCSMLEDFVPGSLEVAARFDMVSSSVVDEAGLMTLLGQLHLKMDQILDRVSSKPNSRKKKLHVLGSSGYGLGYNMESGNGVHSSRDLALDPGPDPGTIPSTDMDSGTGLDPGSNKEIVSNFKPLGPFLASIPELLSMSLSSNVGLETQGIGDSSNTSVQGRGGGLAIPMLSLVLLSDVGLESQGVGDLGEFFVQGKGSD